MPRHKGSKPRNPHSAANRGPYRSTTDTPYYRGLENFREFCRREKLPFRELLVNATELVMNHWNGADAAERREFRKKLRRAA